MEKNDMTNFPSISIPSSISSIPERLHYHCWGCTHMKLKSDSEKFTIAHVPVCLIKNRTIAINVFHSIPSWCPTDGEFKDEIGVDER